VTSGMIRATCAAGVVAALAAGAATAGAVDANVVATYDTPGAPGDVRYAYGATWVDAPEAGALMKVTPGAQAPQTIQFPGQIVDFAEGYGKMWVLWRKGAKHYLASVNPNAAKIIGSARRTRLPGSPDGLAAGAGAVWASGEGPTSSAKALRKKTTLSRVNPRTHKVANRRWPVPTRFFAEKGLLWSFRGLRLQRRAPRTLETRGSVKAFSGFNAVTYGLGNFWTSSEGVMNLGGVTKISPTKGRAAPFSFPNFIDGAGGIATGNGTVWALYQENSPGPWSVVGFSPSGTTTNSVDVQIGEQPAVAYGAGSIWVTDGSGQRLLEVTPPS
jgi:hypothetical protein